MNPNQRLRTSQVIKVRRRDLLRCMSGATVASLWGCIHKSSTVAKPTGGSTQSVGRPDCVVRPQQTEGPYFVDEGLNRSDIRSDPADGSVQEGMPLHLTFHISQVSPNACLPVEGAIVDLWHCDAQGIYADVEDPRFSTVGKKFLRGYQTTDASGTVDFITIYPGAYPGRAVHLHFKIRSSGNSQRSYEFTSQLYFDDALSDQIYTQSPYNVQGQRTTRNDNDGIFQNGGEQLILQLTQDLKTESYAGIFNIGLEMA